MAASGAGGSAKRVSVSGKRALSPKQSRQRQTRNRKRAAGSARALAARATPRRSRTSSVLSTAAQTRAPCEFRQLCHVPASVCRRPAAGCHARRSRGETHSSCSRVHLPARLSASLTRTTHARSAPQAVFGRFGAIVDVGALSPPRGDIGCRVRAAERQPRPPLVFALRVCLAQLPALGHPRCLPPFAAFPPRSCARRPEEGLWLYRVSR